MELKMLEEIISAFLSEVESEVCSTSLSVFTWALKSDWVYATRLSVSKGVCSSRIMGGVNAPQAKVR